MSSDDSESFAAMWQAAVAAHVRDMPAGELNALVQQHRPEAAADAHLPVARRAAFADKVSQLAQMADDANGQGYQHGIADAADAYGGIKYPQPPQPVEQPGPQPFAPNRAQNSSDGGPAPVNERDLNRQKIADIRAQRGL